MATTAQKVAWIIALVGLILALVGGFNYQATADLFALLTTWVGFYLLPLSLAYLVYLTKDRHFKAIGLLVGLAMLYAAYVLVSIPIFGIATRPTPMAEPFDYLIMMWPSILLLIVSIYSLVRKKKV